MLVCCTRVHGVKYTREKSHPPPPALHITIITALLSIAIPFSPVLEININDDIGSGNWRYRVVGQTKWNKQNCSGATGNEAMRRICGVLGYVILFYVFAISCTRKYFQRVNPFVSHQLFVHAAGRRFVRREQARLEFREMQRSRSHDFRYARFFFLLLALHALEGRERREIIN